MGPGDSGAAEQQFTIGSEMTLEHSRAAHCILVGEHYHFRFRVRVFFFSVIVALLYFVENFSWFLGLVS